MMSNKVLASLLVIVAAAISAESSAVRFPFAGQDPNDLSCDPLGQIFLLLPHFTDCNKFYVCDHGKEVERQCSSPNLIFDFVIQACNWPWAAVCKLRDRDTVEGSGEDEGDLAWANQEAVNSEPLSIDHTPILNCMSSDDASRRVANKNDCQRFWRCDNGQLTAAFCTDGLYFNSVSQQCDFEANVKCAVEQVDEIGSEFIVYK